jgi:hypothetical protein
MKLKIENISEDLKINILSKKFAQELDRMFFSFRDQFSIPLKRDLPKSTTNFILKNYKSIFLMILFL